MVAGARDWPNRARNGDHCCRNIFGSAWRLRLGQDRVEQVPPLATRLIVAWLILAANFPTAYTYQQLVTARVTTNRYVFRNESGALIEDLAVFHRERQIGFCKTLEPNAATTIYFSALNNGGEGPISFSGIQGDGNAIGGDTGMMAFVFMKSHGQINLLPNGEYQIVIQNFTKGIATEDPKLTKWPAAALPE